MIISKRSWHYRLINDYSPFWVQRSLCGYFWQVVTLSLAIIIGVPTALAAVVLGGPLFWIYGGDPLVVLIQEYPFIIKEWMLASMILGFIGWIAVAICAILFTMAGCFIGIGKVIDLVKGEYKPDEESTELKEPGLFRSWVAAKRDKICPILEFKD